MKKLLTFTKELSDKLIDGVEYKFSNFFVRGFYKNYLCYSIGVDEYEELLMWFPLKTFTKQQLTDKIKIRIMKFELHNKKG